MASKQITYTGSVTGIYEVQYKKSSDTVWSISPNSPVTGTTTTLANLLDNTTYQIRIRALCNDRVSPWLYDNFLTGNALCPIVTNISVGSITSTTANVSWTASNNSIGYIVQYKKPTDSNWLTGPTTISTSYQITSLITSTSYQTRVISLCPNGQQTSSANVSFTTI